jgi:hypothetical protein
MMFASFAPEASLLGAAMTPTRALPAAKVHRKFLQRICETTPESILEIDRRKLCATALPSGSAAEEYASDERRQDIVITMWVGSLRLKSVILIRWRSARSTTMAAPRHLPRSTRLKVFSIVLELCYATPVS